VGCGKRGTPAASPVGWTDDLREALEHVVTGPVRREKAYGLLNELDHTLDVMAEETQDVRGELFRTLANYDTTADEIREIQGRLRAVRNERWDDVMRIAVESRQLLTEEEWAVFGNTRAEQMKAQEEES